MKYLKNEFKGWKLIELIWIVVALSTIIGISVYWKDTILGIICSITGVLCVISTGKGKLQAYFWGLINIVLYVIISYQAKFYGEVMLNTIYYIPMQFIGFYLWFKNIGDKTEVTKQRLKFKNFIYIILGAVVAVVGYGFVLKSMDGSSPFLDSMSTVLSIFAMVLSVKRYMEQWIIWIFVNIVTIIMWVIQLINGGNDIAVLLMWSIYLLNAIFMFVKWNKESKEVENVQV